MPTPTTAGRLSVLESHPPHAYTPLRPAAITHSTSRSQPFPLTTKSRQHLHRPCQASMDDEIDIASINVDIAAGAFAKGTAEGADEDDLIAQQLGKRSASQLTATQERYKDKIKAKLEARAEELRKEKEARSFKLTQGKLAYSRGQYDTSVLLLEGALEEEGALSPLGGEIQMWLALAYQACGREKECIDTYKVIENTHPVASIRRQAAGLRYIMEAPKLEISADEKVKIPVLTDLDPNKGGRAPAPRLRGIQKTERPKTWDEEFWANYEPPKYLKNRYVWAAGAILTVGIAWYSATLN